MFRPKPGCFRPRNNLVGGGPDGDHLDLLRGKAIRLAEMFTHTSPQNNHFGGGMQPAFLALPEQKRDGVAFGNHLHRHRPIRLQIIHDVDKGRAVELVQDMGAQGDHGRRGSDQQGIKPAKAHQFAQGAQREEQIGDKAQRSRQAVGAGRRQPMNVDAVPVFISRQPGIGLAVQVAAGHNLYLNVIIQLAKRADKVGQDCACAAGAVRVKKLVNDAHSHGLMCPFHSVKREPSGRGWIQQFS